MRPELCRKSLNLVLNLSLEERMHYFAYKVSLSGYLCLLTDEESFFRASYDAKDDDILSVWPSPEFISIALGKEKEPYITTVELREFLDKYIPRFARDNIHIGVFPNSSLCVCKMKPEVFREMMEDKMREIEMATKEISYANVILQLTDNHKIHHKPEKIVEVKKG
jgi:hypothetical protein